MTTAVCFKCGEQKFGAFTPCGICKQIPRTDDELVLSIAMTDHYFSVENLMQMGQRIKEGKPPELSGDTKKQLLTALHSQGISGALKMREGNNNESIQKSRKWWRFWD